MNIGFKSVHPFSAFIFFVFTFILSMTASHPVLLGLCLFSGLVYDIKLSEKKAVSFFLKAIIPMMLLITVLNAVFSHYGVTVLFTMHNGNSFTLEALVFGFVFSLRTASALLWLDCFNEIITSDKFIFLFGRISPRVALVISMVLRFIPLIRSQSEDIKKAEKGVGNLPAETDFIGKIRNSARRLSILISWTLEKGIDTSDSMRARGYGLPGKTSYNNYTFSFKDLLMLILSLTSVACLFIVGENLKATFNPIIDIPMLDVISVIITVIFTINILLPTVYDLWEERKWSISKLKN